MPWTPHLTTCRYSARAGRSFSSSARREEGRAISSLPAKIFIDYDDLKYFQPYADPNFELEYLVFVTNQFGNRMVNVYGFGKERGKKYPTDEELLEQLKERLKKLKPQEPSEKAPGTDAEKK